MSEQKVRNRPEISVIVPVYRVEKYLNDCIDSILAQTFADFELILVDDGSPDSCPALCDAAAARDSRIRVIHQKNRGLSGARNAGLDAAEGEWIAFVDSDDMLLPQALEKAHSTAEKTGADVVLYGFAFTDENGKVYDGWDTTQYDEVIPQQEIYNRLVIGMYQSMCNKLFRRELFDGLRLPEGKKFEDTYTAPRIYERVQKMASIPESLYQYRHGWDTTQYDEVIPQQEIYNRLVIGMYQSMCNKLFRRELFDGLRLPEGKKFEDTYTAPRIYERVQKMASIPESLYQYRQVPESIMHSNYSVKTLDRVEACYQMFLGMYRHNAETLCEAYRTVLTALVDIWWHLTPEERRSPRMKECMGYERDARHKLWQARAITLRGISDTIRYTRSPAKYLELRRERQAKLQNLK